MRKETELAVIGAGPAGVSAALYAHRAGRRVCVLYRGLGTSSLARAEGIENYYGMSEPVTGAVLERRGIEGAARIGVPFEKADVMGIRLTDAMDGYIIETDSGEVRAKAVVLATGTSRKTLSLPGLAAFNGKGVSYCAICDAFFYRGKTVAVLGAGAYAWHEAQDLKPHAGKLYLLTNGEQPSFSVPDWMEVRTEKLEAIVGEGRVQRVAFAGGGSLPVDGVFVALGTAGSTELARKAGILLEGNAIRVNADMATNMPGLFAAGDATGGLLQVAKAVCDGARAGLSAVQYLRKHGKT